jgi:acyl-CoA synthetase (AMP-forming)/AMP-acid ligase II
MTLLFRKLGPVADLVSGESWPSERLTEEVEMRTERLTALEVGSGDNVMIRHGGTPGFFADLLAVWRIGACAACLPPNLTARELENVIRFLKPDLVLGTRDQVDIGNGAAKTSWLGAPDLRGAALPTTEGAAGLDSDALILFTSGTTGMPKGVVHSFRSILARVSLNQAWIPAQERDVTLCPLPTHFGHGLIGNCLTPLLDGGALYLVNAGDIRTVAGLGDLIDTHKVSFMSSVPSMWKTVLRSAKALKPGRLKRIHVGSAPLSADLWREISQWAGTCNVVNMYGITETANWIGGASAVEFEPADGLVGRPWGGAAAVRLDDGRIAPEGMGEILVQTPSLMSRYHQRSEETRQTMPAGWFTTGDVGEISSDGVIRLTGRSKDEINRAGLKISPQEIDILLEKNEMVAQACAFALADEIAGEIVAAALCPAGDGFDLAAVKAWCAERLMREKCPERWYVTAELPINERGKINRAALPEFCSRLTPA